MRHGGVNIQRARFWHGRKHAREQRARGEAAAATAGSHCHRDAAATLFAGSMISRNAAATGTAVAGDLRPVRQRSPDEFLRDCALQAARRAQPDNDLTTRTAASGPNNYKEESGSLSSSVQGLRTSWSRSPRAFGQLCGCWPEVSGQRHYSAPPLPCRASPVFDERRVAAPAQRLTAPAGGVRSSMEGARRSTRLAGLKTGQSSEVQV